VRIIPNINIIENNRILDVTVISNVRFFKNHGVFYCSIDNGSTRHQTVTDLCTRIIFCRRKIIHLGINIRILFKEIISCFRLQEIHIGFKIIINRSNVSPVIRKLVSVDFLHILITDQNILHKIITVFFRTLLNHLNQLTSSDHIDSAGNRIGLRYNRLLFEFFNPAFFIHLHCTETVYIHTCRHVLADNCNIRLLGYMIFQYLIVIHLVNTVTGCNYYIRLMAVFKEGQILCHGICSSTIPEIVLCRNRRSKLSCNKHRAFWRVTYFNFVYSEKNAENTALDISDISRTLFCKLIVSCREHCNKHIAHMLKGRFCTLTVCNQLFNFTAEIRISDNLNVTCKNFCLFFTG